MTSFDTSMFHTRPTLLQAVLGPHQASALTEAQQTQVFGFLLELLQTQGTVRQVDIGQRYFVKNQSQSEIARELGLGQSTVHKTLFGVKLYTPTKYGKVYGGVIKKIQLVLERDEFRTKLDQLLSQ
jgi:predicted DNA-binding protein YlxM (UPF0122 family)